MIDKCSVRPVSDLHVTDILLGLFSPKFIKMTKMEKCSIWTMPVALRILLTVLIMICQVSGESAIPSGKSSDSSVFRVIT